MPTYASYGVCLDSELPLDLPGSASSSSPDVTVRLGPVPRPPPDLCQDVDGCWRATPDEMFYFWSDVGAFCVDGTSRITLDPNSQVAESLLRLVVQGRLLAAVLHARGRLVLHGSAVAGPRGALGVVAHSGTGKSTTAAALIKAGHDLLADDILTVDLAAPEPTVYPGGGGLKLWSASVSALHLDEELPPVWEGSSKRMWRPRCLTEPVPLRGLYVLKAETGPLFERPSGPRAVVDVMSRSYCGEELRHCGTERNLAQVADLVRRVPVRFLRRSLSIDGFNSWAAAVVSDVERFTKANH